jgi:high-affinity iron transporter
MDMIVGGVLGVLAGVCIAAIMYLGLLTIPARRLFVVTSALITLLAAGLAAQAMAFVQQAGYFEVLTWTLWDSSWLLSSDSLVGRLAHALIGYMDRPNGAELATYVLTIAVMLSLMRYVSSTPAQARKAIAN